VLGEEFLPRREMVWLEEDAEEQRALRGPRDMRVAGRAPDELAGQRLSLVIDEATFEHVGLFHRPMLVQRDLGTRFQLEQDGGHPRIRLGVQHLHADAGKLGLLPRHLAHLEIDRRRRGLVGKQAPARHSDTFRHVTFSRVADRHRAPSGAALSRTPYAISSASSVMLATIRSGWCGHAANGRRRRSMNAARIPAALAPTQSNSWLATNSTSSSATPQISAALV